MGIEDDLMTEKFDSFAWARLVTEKMKELEEEVWKERYKIFPSLEKQLEDSSAEN